MLCEALAGDGHTDVKDGRGPEQGDVVSAASRLSHAGVCRQKESTTAPCVSKGASESCWGSLGLNQMVSSPVSVANFMGAATSELLLLADALLSEHREMQLDCQWPVPALKKLLFSSMHRKIELLCLPSGSPNSTV